MNMLFKKKTKKSRYVTFKVFEKENSYLNQIGDEIQNVFKEIHKKAENDEVYRKEVKERLVALSYRLTSDALTSIREFTWNRIQDRSEMDFDKRGFLLDAINLISDGSHSLPADSKRFLESEWDKWFVTISLPRAVYAHVAMGYWLEDGYFGVLFKAIKDYQVVLPELENVDLK